MGDERLTIDMLLDWTASGGHWQVVDATPSQVEVDLCACTGEAMQRAWSAEPSVIAYVTAHRPDLDASEG